MHLDLRLSRALDRVELVTGLGTPSTGRMCVMSLVACLAAEGHTDRPACASPLIRAFAIPINDNMPQEARQRLKPFAPRIIGTNDGLDGQRIDILRRALADEILPRTLLAGREATATRRFAGPVWRMLGRIGRRRLERQVTWMLDDSLLPEEPASSARAVAAAGSIGRMLARCAQDARDPREAAWHWDMAIGLLDRLCDIGPARAAAPARWADRLEETLAGRELREAGRSPALPPASGSV